MTITINGAKHELHFNFKRLRKLAPDMKGASDGAAVGKMLEDAMADWGKLAGLIAVGLGREMGEHPDIMAWIEDKDLGSFRDFVNEITEAFGLTATVTEGEQSVPPAQPNHGLSAVPSPVSISA